MLFPSLVGMNVYGQLGTGSDQNASVPVEVAGAHTFASLSAGSYHSCGLEIDGGAFCWGAHLILLLYPAGTLPMCGSTLALIFTLCLPQVRTITARLELHWFKQ